MQNLSHFVTLVSDTLGLLAVLAIWQELRNARRRRGWTIEEAAWNVGVDTSTFHRWELGIQTPHPANFARLTQEFDLDIRIAPMSRSMRDYSEHEECLLALDTRQARLPRCKSQH